VLVTFLSDRFGRKPPLVVFAFAMALAPPRCCGSTAPCRC
jgi:hypothetical protein